MNGDFQSDLYTLEFKQGEQREGFHSRIIRLKQYTNLSGEIVSPKILIIQYMKALSKCDNLEALITSKMTDLIIFLDNNGKPAIYTG